MLDYMYGYLSTPGTFLEVQGVVHGLIQTSASLPASSVSERPDFMPRAQPRFARIKMVYGVPVNSLPSILSFDIQYNSNKVHFRRCLLYIGNL